MVIISGVPIFRIFTVHGKQSSDKAYRYLDRPVDSITSCERMTTILWSLMLAIDAYTNINRRSFPGCWGLFIDAGLGSISRLIELKYFMKLILLPSN